MPEEMTDAAKRKEPEALTTTPSGDTHEGEPETKRQKTDEAKPGTNGPADPKPSLPEMGINHHVLRRQVEYYFSDENLRQDKFFHEKIAADPEGWLDMSLILSCKKIIAMRATKKDLINALVTSALEVRDSEAGCAIRRKGNAPLPKLEPMVQRKQK